MTSIALILAAYLVGSLSFAVLVSRAFGLPDPRTYGSGNPGATNVLRTGNKGAAALALLGDALKGWAGVWLAVRYGPTGHETWLAPCAALAVFLGHLYPVFHGFAGGKGVATAAGAVIALNGGLGLSLVVVWIATAVLSRMSSLASLAAAAAAPIGAFYVYGAAPAALAMLVLAALVWWRHRTNIRKIIDGTERRIGRA